MERAALQMVRLASVLAATLALAPAGAAATALHPTDAGSTAAFDVHRFGQPLTEAEQREMEGYLWWSVAFGVADAIWNYAGSHPFQPRSTRYWAGMALSATAGATVGGFAGAYIRAIQAATTLSRSSRAGLTLYGYVRTKAYNHGLGLFYRGYSHRDW